MTTAEIDSFGLTDVGLKRRENEDQFLIASMASAVRFESTSLQQGDSALLGHPIERLFIVADGVGGRAAGREASSFSREGLRRNVS